MLLVRQVVAERSGGLFEAVGLCYPSVGTPLRYLESFGELEKEGALVLLDGGPQLLRSSAIPAA